MNANVREYVTDAIKFWERWRLIYNLALAAGVIIHFAVGYPGSKAIALWISACDFSSCRVVDADQYNR